MAFYYGSIVDKIWYTGRYNSAFKKRKKKKKKSEYFSKVQHKKYENGKRTIYVWYEYTFTFKKFVTKIHKYLTYIFWK